MASVEGRGEVIIFASCEDKRSQYMGGKLIVLVVMCVPWLLYYMLSAWAKKPWTPGFIPWALTDKLTSCTHSAHLCYYFSTKSTSEMRCSKQRQDMFRSIMRDGAYQRDRRQWTFCGKITYARYCTCVGHDLEQDVPNLSAYNALVHTGGKPKLLPTS
jgi:hypothetical protein